MNGARSADRRSDKMNTRERREELAEMTRRELWAAEREGGEAGDETNT